MWSIRNTSELKDALRPMISTETRGRNVCDRLRLRKIRLCTKNGTRADLPQEYKEGRQCGQRRLEMFSQRRMIRNAEGRRRREIEDDMKAQQIRENAMKSRVESNIEP
eukprot:scaffold33128_cov39-Cyclotella_meneghiniana.AAC.1